MINKTVNSKLTPVYIDEDEVSFSRKRKEKLDNFHPIGRINSMYSDEERHDIFDALAIVSKPAYSLFNQLKNNRNPEDNLTYIFQKLTMTKSEKVMQATRIKELKGINVICKVKQKNKRLYINPASVNLIKNNPVVYMINPGYIKCPGNQQAAEAIWKLL